MKLTEILNQSGLILVGGLLLIPLQGMAASPSAAAEANNTFAANLYTRLMEGDGNLFFSPFSISTALGMTYGGARGETATQMAKVLRFAAEQEKTHAAFQEWLEILEKIQETGAVELRTANSLWPDKKYPFLPEFLALARRHYGVTITPCDYTGNPESARLRINSWAEQMTKDKIKDLLPSGAVTSLTRLVLANAIYFKGKWAVQFNPQQTKEAPFFLGNGATAPALFMRQKGSFGFAQHPELSILSMNYQGGDLSLVVLLPAGKDGLGKLEKNLTPERLANWIKSPPSREVEVLLPKFKIKKPVELSRTLARMGMPDAFSEVTADFSGLDGRKNHLYISGIHHQAFVEVNEEGTEAAAATGVVVGLRSIPAPPPVFRADHPFLFLIRENRTGGILFMGRVANPSTL